MTGEAGGNDMSQYAEAQVETAEPAVDVAANNNSQAGNSENLAAELFQQPTYEVGANPVQVREPLVPAIKGEIVDEGGQPATAENPQTTPEPEFIEGEVLIPPLTPEELQNLNEMLANPDARPKQELRNELWKAVSERDMDEIAVQDPALHEALSKFYESNPEVRNLFTFQELVKPIDPAEKNDDLMAAYWHELKTATTTQDRALAMTEIMTKGGDPEGVYNAVKEQPELAQAFNDLGEATAALELATDGDTGAVATKGPDGTVQVQTKNGELFTVQEYAYVLGMLVLDIAFFKGHNTQYLVENMVENLVQGGINDTLKKYGFDAVRFSHGAEDMMSKMLEVMDENSLDRLIMNSKADELYSLLHQMNKEERRKMLKGERFASKFGFGGHQLNERQLAQLNKTLSTLNSTKQMEIEFKPAAEAAA